VKGGPLGYGTDSFEEARHRWLEHYYGKDTAEICVSVVRPANEMMEAPSEGTDESTALSADDVA
jgi:hypothetical protein